ncbi:MAG: NAD+ synthase [Dehalococcoidia bacterium]|nr:NAD+ synthase [Dehalococcoidia bacterium]
MCTQYTKRRRRTLRIALAQLNTTVGDLEGNSAAILDAARDAAAAGTDLVACPELAITGYPPEDLLIRAAFIDDARDALETLAREAAGLPPLVVGCIDFDRHLYNAAAVLHDGRIAGFYHKHELPNYGVFDEFRYFQPGADAPTFRVAGVDVGVTICEDIWFPGGPMREQALAGARVIVNINASPYHAGKTRHRERMIATRATDNAVAIAYVNQVGGQDELVFDGNSFVLDPAGEEIARAASMAEDLLIVDIPVERVVQTQLHDPRIRRDRPLDHRVEPIEVSAAATAPRTPLDSRPPVEPPEELAETYQALVLGTRDYIRKTGFDRVFVAVSGGIDSALVATIAVDAVGPGQVTAISLPSRYSSEGSVADAQELARLLRVRLVGFPLEPLHQAALDTLAREFEGSEPGTAEENLQSRLRGLLTMALSNKEPRSMVLTTGNKSEYACGYATLYGDMSGGFAVIKDVPKTLVYELARYRNTLGDAIPHNSIEKPPSAELRPDQLDSDSLPSYDVLDAILQAYVEDDLPLESIVAAGFDEATVRHVIDLVNRNEYKRRQSPPGVKITTRAFGRDRRLPLASRYRGY